MYTYLYTSKLNLGVINSSWSILFTTRLQHLQLRVSSMAVVLGSKTKKRGQDESPLSEKCPLTLCTLPEVWKQMPVSKTAWSGNFAGCDQETSGFPTEMISLTSPKLLLVASKPKWKTHSNMALLRLYAVLADGLHHHSPLWDQALSHPHSKFQVAPHGRPIITSLAKAIRHFASV